MQTPIGRQLRDSRRNLVTASCVAVFAIAADLAIVWWVPWPEYLQARWTVALVALVAQVRLAGGDLPSLGLVLQPAQGWWYWARMTLWIGLAVAVIIVVGLGAWVLAGGELPVYTTPPERIGTSFLLMCVYAPLQEETLYRLVLCVPLAVALGPWGAIVASGMAFAVPHVLSGIASPENLFGGLFLAWAYLKSGSISIPLLLHSLGNLLVLAAQVAGWYWLHAG
ncbi:MAG TPA: CPBP family intramembrane glutamic endopeptidase [Planctomycetaceae bacterium]|nr:CPBP family intramembrane glutamic endopeptidase [Planctomycetaceae bacterium]